MSRCSPFVVVLAGADRTVLEERARAYTAPFAVVVRAKIVLLAAQGVANMTIAARLIWMLMWSANGVNDSSPRGWPDCLTASVLGVHGRSRRR